MFRIFVISSVLMFFTILIVDNSLQAQSPGEVVGYTQDVLQTPNSSTGRRVAVDNQGGVHFAWMNTINYPEIREVYYNYVDTEGNWLQPSEGRPVSLYNRAGFCQVSVSEGNRTAVAYHSANSGDYVIYAVDMYTGFGVFDYYDPPDTMDYRCYWPYFSIDRNGNVHMLVTEYNPFDPRTVGYTRSSNGGISWSQLVAVDTLNNISAVAVSSPVSDKVAIAYCHPADPVWDWFSDIYYIESLDGINWDWDDGKINVTNYADDRDSIFANQDLDAVYDYDDNLHIIWNGQWISSAGGSMQFLYHYDVPSREITEMNVSDSVWIPRCNFGAGVYPFSKMSLGVSEATNYLYAVYIGVNAFDCSAWEFANGEIMLQWSPDGGHSWSEPVNLTNSHSPDCQPGACDSDVWPSLADKVTEYLHVFYFVNLSGGGDWHGDCPALYLAYPIPTTGTASDVFLPIETHLVNYPNPFNATTIIRYALPEPADVTIEIYNILGRRVETLIQAKQQAGYHQVVWVAENASSGMYFYCIQAGEYADTRKMILLK